MATVIQTKKKESEFSGVAKAAAAAVAQQLREQKDGDYYLKNLKLLGALQRTNDTAGVGEVATAEAVKPKADPTVAPAGYMAPEAGDWVQDVAKAQGVDMSQPAFIANQPGFNKAQAAVAAEQVTPRLDEEQMQDPRKVDEYRRSIGKGAQFGTESDFIPKVTQERRARSKAVKAFADKKKAQATALQERLDAPILQEYEDAEVAAKAKESWVHDESGMLVPNKDYTENRRWKAFKDSLTKEERRQNIREEQLASDSHWRTSAENLAIANQANVKDALINAGMVSANQNLQAPIVTPDTNYEFGVPAENPESVRQAELLRKSWKGMKK